jgi:rubredoxin
MCPECGSGEVTVQEYDFGICRETGYHDAGERFRCRACGAAGEADDLVPIKTAGNSISVGSSERPRGGG